MEYPDEGVGSGFRYKSEKKQGVRKSDVKRDETLLRLREVWFRFKFHGPPYDNTVYTELPILLQGIDYSAEDIRRMCIALAEFQDEKWFSVKAGYFLSALINNGKEKNYVLSVHHLVEPICRLGRSNTKNITIEGDVGERLGDGMTGGRIIVNGNADSYAGAWLRGGRIEINGDVCAQVGDCMQGGEIHINGEYLTLGDNLCGKIYYKGQPIVDHNSFHAVESSVRVNPNIKGVYLSSIRRKCGRV